MISYIKPLAFFVTLTSTSHSCLKDGCHQPCPVEMMMRRISSTCIMLVQYTTSYIFSFEVCQSFQMSWYSPFLTSLEVKGQQELLPPSSSLVLRHFSPASVMFWCRAPFTTILFFLSGVMAKHWCVLGWQFSQACQWQLSFKTQLRDHHGPTHFSVSHCSTFMLPSKIIIPQGVFGHHLRFCI